MRKIVLLGDSIAKGVVRDNPQARYRISEHSFAKNCEEMMNVQINNLGRLGSTISHGLVTLAHSEEDVKKCDEVWVLFGGNDANMDWLRIGDDGHLSYKPATPLNEFEEKYERLIHSIKKHRKQIVLLSLPPVAAYKFTQNVSRSIKTPEALRNWMRFISNNASTITNLHEMYNLEIFKLGQKHSLPVIDLTTPFLQERPFEPYFCDDGMHPNDEGHFLISKTIERARPDLVKRMDNNQVVFWDRGIYDL